MGTKALHPARTESPFCLLETGAWVGNAKASARWNSRRCPEHRQEGRLDASELHNLAHNIVIVIRRRPRPLAVGGARLYPPPLTGAPRPTRYWADSSGGTMREASRVCENHVTIRGVQASPNGVASNASPHNLLFPPTPRPDPRPPALFFDQQLRDHDIARQMPREIPGIAQGYIGTLYFRRSFRTLPTHPGATVWKAWEYFWGL